MRPCRRSFAKLQPRRAGRAPGPLQTAVHELIRGAVARLAAAPVRNALRVRIAAREPLEALGQRREPRRVRVAREVGVPADELEIVRERVAARRVRDAHAARVGRDDLEVVRERLEGAVREG